MSSTLGQGQSTITQYKQQDLETFLRYWFKLVKNIRGMRSQIVYIDTNAGSGYNHDCKVEGSPIIFCKEVQKAKIPYVAYFIEKNQEYASELEKRTQGFNRKIYCGDNEKMLPRVLAILPRKSLGLLYSDPNGIPPWGILKTAASHERAGKIDILIRYNTLAVKRNQHNGYHLERDLLCVKKKYWWGKEYYEFDKWNWSFLLGMNYPYGSWRKQGWKRFDTKDGQDLKKRLAYKKSELKKKLQPHLTGLM